MAHAGLSELILALLFQKVGRVEGQNQETKKRHLQQEITWDVKQSTWRTWIGQTAPVDHLGGWNQMKQMQKKKKTTKKKAMQKINVVLLR